MYNLKVEAEVRKIFRIGKNILPSYKKHAKLSCLVRRKINGSEKEFVHAADNVLKVLILFIGFLYDTNHF